jgi:nicotinate-nucleotide--dimethylbenzimidazole phosphoribosyltransferase
MQEFIKGIPSIYSTELKEKIQARLDDLTKPPGSLGRLEDFVIQYCLCRGREDADVTKMKMFTFAGDHGITEEGVSPFPKEVTQQMVMNMVHQGAAINVLCKNGGIETTVVDVGVDGDLEEISGLISRKVKKGTDNFCKGPAMSEEDCRSAMGVGFQFAQEDDGDLYGIGEMGIGNTSSASSLYSLFLSMDPAVTVGAGTGAKGELLELKKRTVTKAVEMHRKEWDGSGFDGLRRLGGFEIAAMTGFIFGAASRRVPVVVDGFISSAAALSAMEIYPEVQDYLYFSHTSAEHFHREFIMKMKLMPLLDLGMRLGEGTGAALAMGIIKQALNLYHQMATFSSAGVSKE